jgi:hypothetical protein
MNTFEIGARLRLPDELAELLRTQRRFREIVLAALRREKAHFFQSHRRHAGPMQDSGKIDGALILSLDDDFAIADNVPYLIAWLKLQHIPHFRRHRCLSL